MGWVTQVEAIIEYNFRSFFFLLSVSHILFVSNQIYILEIILFITKDKTHLVIHFVAV